MRRILATSVLASMALASPLHAGIPAASCINPTVFPDAAVNVVLLPFSTRSSEPKGLAAAAQRFTVLMQFETLFSILKFGEVGVVRLVADQKDIDSGRCSPSNVLDMLLGKLPGARNRMLPHHGLVVVWGTLYEENGSLFVNTNVRFLRAGDEEAQTVQVKNVTFTTRVPASAVSLPSQLLTKVQLTAIQQQFQEFATFHDSPVEGQGRPFPIELLTKSDGWTYWVADSRPGWIKLETSGVGKWPRGWVRLGALGGSSATRLTSLDFIEGAVGYLRTRTGREAKVDPASKAMQDAADAALSRFVERAGQEQSASAIALGLRCALRLNPARITTDGIGQALTWSTRAREALPYNANLRGIALVAQLYLAYQGQGTPLRIADMATAFEQAVAVEPSNPDVLRNAIAFYQLVDAAGPPAQADHSADLSSEEVKRRLTRLQPVGG
jgi:hypothetical protein